MIREESLKKLEDDFTAMAEVLNQQFVLVGRHLEGISTSEEMTHEGENEKQLDQYEVQFREAIVNEILRLTPRARDLRRMIALLNIIVDLERMGDLLHSINKRLVVVLETERVWQMYRQPVLRLFGMVNKMYENVIYAFQSENDFIAHNVIGMDDEVDSCYHEAHRSLFQQDVKSPDMQAYLDLSRILYLLERIGDSCTNIAEDLIYLIEGVNVKHTKTR